MKEILKDISKIPPFTQFAGMIIACMLLFYSPASAADFAVSGQVKDALTQKGIPAARITVVHEQVSATTDDGGNFSLKSASGSALLRVSAYGYATREIPVQGKKSVLIELYPATFSRIKPTTGSVTLSTLSEPFFSTAVSADEIISQAFAGELRSVSRSGAIGVGSSLFIRGLNSVNLNAQPLFVVDGVVRDNLYEVKSIHQGFFPNPLANIESNDIESITVLREGTSIYGAKAANGVILINTKRARDMVTKINLNISTGFSDVPRTIPVLGADDYRIYLSEMLGTAGLTNEEVLQLPYLNDDPKRSTYKRYHNNTNWSDQVYRKGTQNNYAINVTGGDDKALYYFSLGYTSNNGVVKNNDFQRYNMRLNADIKMTDRIQTAIGIGFSRIDRNLIDDGVEYFNSPTLMSLVKAPLLSPYNYTFLGDLTTEYAFADIFDIGNPQAVIDHSINTVKQNSFNISIKPQYQINSSLKFTEHFDYYLNKTNEDYYRPYLYAAPVFIPGVGDSFNARMSQVMRSNVITSDMRLSYEKKLDARNMLSAMIGTRVIYNSYESDYVEGHNSRSNSSINLKGSFKNLVTDGINDITKTISHYFNADYTLDSKYFITATMSVDASSRFGTETKSGLKLFGHNWALFPSVNAAWLASSEEFMSGIDLINLLKLKVGYDVTGNDGIPDYQSGTYFNTVKFTGVANGIVLSNLANPEIQWENTGRAHAGIDLGLFNDRINISLDAFSSVTNNLLVMKDLPEVSGLGKYWKNEGQLSNVGFEAGLVAKVLNMQDFQWEAGVTVGHYRNKITELPSGSFTTKVAGGEVITQVGQSAGMFWGYKINGVFATEAEAKAANLQMLSAKGVYTQFGAGDIIFEDVADANGVKDGIINEQDKQLIGDPNPDFYGSVVNKFSFRNFSLNALFTFSSGNDVYNYPRHLLESQQDMSNQSVAVLSRWTSEGQQTSQPKAVYGDPMGNSRFSDRWIEDGSYLRLKSLTLGYQLPIRSTFIDGVNLWISAENLFTLTNYLGADPESSAGNTVLYQGVDAGLLPLTKSYVIGFRFSL